ncbi:MAG: excinuclease ABC subunit UvrC [Gammaproteobacteria bacterium]
MNCGNESFEVSAFLSGLTSHPGVYRMFDTRGEVIYVGKARNLRKRLGSYFRRQDFLPQRTQALMSRVRTIEITVTQNETEALILEHNLIKAFRPRYNVLLRDDKSYPYIHISTDQRIPRLSFHRGALKSRGRYFGPFPNATAVRQSLSLLQQLFQLRQCEDSFFHNRTRPCLQHQIKRCTAPCVRLVDENTYRADVDHAVMFLEATNEKVLIELMARMDEAARSLEFERAARYRDQIAMLKQLQQRQYVSGPGGDIDVVAARCRDGVAVVEVFFIRKGQNLGNKTFFPAHSAGLDASEILDAFLPQYYLRPSVTENMPAEILISEAVGGQSPLTSVLTQRCGRKVSVTHRVRGTRSQWLAMAINNAEIALTHQLSRGTNLQARFEALRETLGLASVPQRIEGFDVSHTQGEATVAACVVFGLKGALKSDYRRYNIRNITPGDDYAALSQALARRYGRLQKDEGVFPDIIMVDGGRGQLSQVQELLLGLGIRDVLVVGVAKGPARKAGHETIFSSRAATALTLPATSPALQLIQQIRDESHRFAIAGHRSRRARARRVSVLEGISGIGAQRRQRLLREFGGLQGIASAGVSDLARVKGIGQELAQLVYEAFHRND